jgi:hypothetical protein
LALLLALVQVAGLAGCASRHEPIYRHINVLDGGTAVRLGEPIPDRGLVDRLDDTTLVFRPGTFGGGGTHQIWAYTDSAGILRRLEFFYDGSEGYAVKVRDYQTSLGPPTGTLVPREGASGVYWQDSLTRFSLYLDPKRPNPLWSELQDLSVSP